MRPARVAALIVGCLLLLPGVAMLFGGGALGLGYAFARNDDGYFDFELERLQTPTAALRSEEIDFLAEPGTPDWLIDWLDADLRLEATATGEQALFVGIAPAADSEAYLADTAHDTVIDLVDERSPVYERSPGGEMLAPPVEQDFWAAQATGTGTTTLDWEAAGGRWVAIIANADGSPGVTADLTVAARSGAFLPMAIGLLALGAVATTAGVVLIVAGTRRKGQDRGPSKTAVSPVAGIGDSLASQEHPVSLSARLDPDLARWKWLVKWFLAIPHLIVLVFLWIAFTVLTFVAGVAILFTGRYPQGIYEFNLGVLRWTWRVNYYAWSGGIGTDRYPPFSLQREPDYPAVLDIAYPEQLSRGLVLVKWWLLAIPHYLIVGLLVGGSVRWAAEGEHWGFDPFGGGGLLGLLVLITGVILLFTGAYPKSLFDLIIGFNRWVFRVIAYAALMTDRYPPFRLDQGGAEPGSPLPPPTPEARSGVESGTSDSR